MRLPFLIAKITICDLEHNKSITRQDDAHKKNIQITDVQITSGGFFNRVLNTG